MRVVEEYYDVVVVGAGHAGCEAALAAARLGCETILFTVSMNSVALMPCNPNIGGSSKGHLVREIDALGGEMGKNIDKTYIQSKMLNKSKGPAVHSLRAQADKDAYSISMRYTLQNTDHLDTQAGRGDRTSCGRGQYPWSEDLFGSCLSCKDGGPCHGYLSEGEMSVWRCGGIHRAKRAAGSQSFKPVPSG